MAGTTIFDDLPEALLLHILSFLPTIDAVRASSVCRKWRNLWKHVPTLNFDMRFDRFPHHTRSQSRVFFADLITQSLFHRPLASPIHGFNLFFDYIHSHRSQFLVDSWVRRATTTGAAVLRLSLDSSIQMYDRDDDEDGDTDESDAAYEFHFRDLRNSSVAVLELVRCRIVWPKSVTAQVFPSLRSIYLDYVYLDGEEFAAMVSSCVNLEALTLGGEFTFDDFKIHSQKLVKLEVWYSTMGYLEIHAPSLRTINLYNFSVEKCCVRDLSSLAEARVVFSPVDSGCWCKVAPLLKGVKRLNLRNMRVNGNEGLEGLSINSLFKSLKFLALEMGYTGSELLGIAAVLELCPVLEELELDYCHKTDDSSYDEFLWEEFLWEELTRKPVIFHIPCLKQVRLKSYSDTPKELWLVEILKAQQMVLDKIVAFPEKVSGKSLHPFVLFSNSNGLMSKGCYRKVSR